MKDQKSWGAGNAGSEADPFIDFYRVEYPQMVRLAHTFLGSPETAEDVTQEAFARLQGRIGHLENPQGYLRTTVVNLCRDRARHRLRERRLEGRMQPVGPLSLGASEMLDVLIKLPFRQRAVLVCRYWGDWSEQEIADALGCRPGTVKTLASRGLDRLRRQMES